MILEPITQQAVIETERYQLRPLQVSDAGLIALHTGDLRVARQRPLVPAVSRQSGARMPGPLTPPNRAVPSCLG